MTSVVVDVGTATVVVEGGSSVAVDVPVVSVVQVGLQGPPGPAGADGGSTFTATSSAALSGHRCVTWLATGLVAYADNLTPAHAWGAVGITLGAGTSVQVQTFGRIDEPTWAWTPLGVIYCGANGVLTQTPPAAPAFCRVLGHAITATSMWVDVQTPITQV